MPKENRVVADLQSVPTNVGLARLIAGAVAAQAGFTHTEVEEVKVAVSEAVTNAVVHGYGSDPSKIVRLEIAIQDGLLELVIADTGRGIVDLDLARQPAVSSDPERMGLGFCFMESYMDEFEVQTAPGQGTRITMRKRVTTDRLASMAPN